MRIGCYNEYISGKAKLLFSYVQFFLTFHLEFGPGECCSLVVCVTVVDGRFYIKPVVTFKILPYQDIYIYIYNDFHIHFYKYKLFAITEKIIYPSISVFDKLIIMVHHCPKELLIWHCTVLSLGQMAQLIMIILSLTTLTLC